MKLDFMTIINEEIKYWELKESIRMMNSQRSDTETINLIEERRKIGIDQVIKQWIIYIKLKSQV